MRDFRDARLMAAQLKAGLAERNVALGEAQALHLVATQFGYDDWNGLAAMIDAAEPSPRPADAICIQPAIPILRIFSVDKAMEFYRDFLGFTVDWDHRFAEGMPLYCQVSRSDMLLHLSEHAGDASPGARVFVPMTGAAALQKELVAKNYAYMRPGLEQAPWGLEVSVTDPFSNRITFCERETKPAA